MHDRHQDRVEHRGRVPGDVLEVATQHDHRVGLGAHFASTSVVVARQGEEDVVEVRCVHGELLGADRVLVEPVQQGPQRFRAAVAGNPQGQCLVVPGGVGEDPGGRVEFGGGGEPEPDVGAGDLALELVGSALGDQAALVEYRDPVGELIGFLEVLGGEEDGHAVGHQVTDDRPHRAAAARVQSRRRLVQEDDLRVADERHRQVQLPAHTPGVGRRRLLRRLHQIEPLQQLRDDPLAVAGDRAVQIHHQLQVLLPGQQLVHRRELTGDPDRRAHRLGLGRDVVPGDAYRPTVGLHQRGQHVHRRRLTRPVRAEQGEDRARADIKIDAVEHDLVLVGLSQS